ncbi:hypothetical protein [Tardiphaga alba]|nr:hypothetical protein [Tardiphaga alba]
MDRSFTHEPLDQNEMSGRKLRNLIIIGNAIAWVVIIAAIGFAFSS